VEVDNLYNWIGCYYSYFASLCRNGWDKLVGLRSVNVSVQRGLKDEFGPVDELELSFCLSCVLF